MGFNSCILLLHFDVAFCTAGINIQVFVIQNEITILFCNFLLLLRILIAVLEKSIDFPVTYLFKIVFLFLKELKRRDSRFAKQIRRHISRIIILLSLLPAATTGNGNQSKTDDMSWRFFDQSAPSASVTPERIDLAADRKNI